MKSSLQGLNVNAEMYICLIDMNTKNKQHATFLVVFQMQKNREQYTRLVLLFSKSSAMKLTLEVLMGENESFSRHLRNVCSNGVPLQVSWFENMIFVIRILEMVLNQYLCSSVNKDIDLLQHVKDKLDDSLLHVTDRFPLYAHSIWKISGLIQLHLSKLT